MNRKIILLPLSLAAVLMLASCGGTNASSSSSKASSSSSSSSAASSSSSSSVASSSSSSSAASSSSSSSSSSLPADHESIKDINEEGAHTIKAVIVGLTETGMLLDDGTGRISTFYSKHKYITDDGFALGDYVKVTETFTKAVNFRYGSYGFSKDAVIAKLDKTKAPTIDYTAAAYTGAQITTWFAAMKAGESASTGDVISGSLTNRPLVTFDAKIVVSGNYVNWLADDFEFDGGTSVNPSTDTNKLANWSKDNANKVYTLTGYLYENVAQAHAYIWLTGMSDAKANETLTAAELTIPDDGKVAATLTTKAEISSYAPKLAVTPTLSDFTWTSDAPTIATVDDEGVITGVAKGTANVTYVHKTIATITNTFAITVTDVPSIDIPATGITVSSTSLKAACAADKGYNSIAEKTSCNTYIAAADLPVEVTLDTVPAIVGSVKGTASNSGYAGAPYDKTSLGSDHETLAFRNAGRVIGFKSPFKTASTVTIVCYNTYATEAVKYMPTVTLAGTEVAVTSPTLDATTGYPGTEFKTVGTKTVYSYTMVYNVSSCDNQYLEIISGASGTTYIESIVIAAAA